MTTKTTKKTAAKKTTIAKANKKKATTKAAATPHSATAQSAPALGLTLDDLNPRETKILAHLCAAGAPQTQAQIATACFPGVRPVAKARSWARNGLRRLVREHFVAKAGGHKRDDGLRFPGEGTYRATAKGGGPKSARKPANASHTSKEAASGDDVAAE